MLILPIKKKWYDMIRNGTKTEEYREIKPYYDCRFQNAFGAIWAGTELLQGELVPEEIRKEPIQTVYFKNGYGKQAPYLTAECSLRVGSGREEWGAEKGKEYYILEIQGLSEQVMHKKGASDEICSN